MLSSRIKQIILGVFTGLSLASTSADAGCLDLKKAQLGNAIGVLLHDKLVEGYEKYTSTEDIVAGILHASSNQQYLLSETTQVLLNNLPKSDPEQTNRTMSVQKAKSLVESWRSQEDSVGDRFIDEFKRAYRPIESDSGLLYMHRKLNEEEAENFSQCFDRAFSTAEKNQVEVCFATVKIDESAVCDIAEQSSGSYPSLKASDIELEYGSFHPDEVIDGWSEAFNIIDSSELYSAENDESNSFRNVLQIVVPPELAYGKKGISGRVVPNETLWFFIATNRRN